MFIKNYVPRSIKVKKRNNFQLIKFSLIFFFVGMILITFKISFTNKIKLDSSILENSFSNNKNVVKIENAKLIGNDERNRPYVITAKSSFKNDSNENLIILHSVEADITLENNSWLLLSTEIASYNILEKLISTEKKALLFYDNGTSLESTKLNYNISSGIAYGHKGVKMFGQWGIINSGSFSLNTNTKKIKFFNNPKLTINYL
tara:strand:- start:319 stop:930 length:612 start_codon:yes stop_codon:yes gene_type:complete